MANQKNHYYVLVMSDNGPVFVTKVNYGDKTAEWNKLEKPLEMSKASAENLVLGLNLNWNTAFLVTMQFELTSQPYNYKDYQIEWKKNDEKGEA